MVITSRFQGITILSPPDARALCMTVCPKSVIQSLGRDSIPITHFSLYVDNIIVFDHRRRVKELHKLSTPPFIRRYKLL